MKKQIIFEAILNEYGTLCIRIPGLDPVIGVEGALRWIPADMGKGFWKKVIRVLREDTRVTWFRGTWAHKGIYSESELYRLAKIKERIELIEKGLRRSTGLVHKRRGK